MDQKSGTGNMTVEKKWPLWGGGNGGSTVF